MRKSLKVKLGAVGTTIALAGALAVVASGTTGAYFSEAKAGAVTGTIGAVHLSTSNTTFASTSMMPGEPQSATVDFTNIGSGPQDFYLTFPNLTALSALNSLGEYGEVHISVNGVEKFASKNLNDGYPCGTAPVSPAVATLCAVPNQIPLALDVAKGAGNTFEFKFNYSGKLKNPLAQGATFNKFPAFKADGVTPDQKTVIAAEGTGFGLPFNVVAVQVGQTP